MTNSLIISRQNSIICGKQYKKLYRYDDLVWDTFNSKIYLAALLKRKDEGIIPAGTARLSRFENSETWGWQVCTYNCARSIQE